MLSETKVINKNEIISIEYQQEWGYVLITLKGNNDIILHVDNEKEAKELVRKIYLGGNYQC